MEIASRGLQCIARFTSTRSCLRQHVPCNLGSLSLKINSFPSCEKSLHTSSSLHYRYKKVDKIPGSSEMADTEKYKESDWLEYNNIVYPPQEPGEPKRPAEYTAHREFPAEQKLLWYITGMIRGLTIDEAIKQLSYNNLRAAHMVKDLLIDMKKEAVEEHHMEFSSNMWIESAYATRLKTNYWQRTKRYRTPLYNSKVFIRLAEGKPPKNYQCDHGMETGHDKLERYIEGQRSRRIKFSL